MSDPNFDRKSLRKSSSRGSYREGNLGNRTELFSVLVAVVVVVVVFAVVVVAAIEVVESSLKKFAESAMKTRDYLSVRSPALIPPVMETFLAS